MTSKLSDVVFEYTGKGHVPEDVTHVRIQSGVTKIEDYAFYGRRSLKEVVLQCITLPSTLVEIGFEAFKGCSSLEEVVFNEGLKVIGGYT